VTYDGNNFNDFPDNHLTKFRIYWLIPDFLSPKIFMKHRVPPLPPIGWMPLTDTTDSRKHAQTNVRSDGVWH